MIKLCELIAKVNAHMFYAHVTVCAQALGTALHDAKKYCTDSKLPEVFDEVVYEIESTKAVAARETVAVMTCLEEMSSKVSESFCHDTPVCA